MPNKGHPRVAAAADQGSDPRPRARPSTELGERAAFVRGPACSGVAPTLVLGALICLAAGACRTTGSQLDAGATDRGVPADAGTTAAACAKFSGPELLGTFPVDPYLTEVSGLAVSRTDGDLLWVNNDSGDGPMLYGLGRDGHLRERLHLTGATAVDWEDLAAGPCPPAIAAEHCLFVGDIGDNAAKHPTRSLYIVPEPSVAPAADGSVVVESGAVLTVTLRYEDGPRDTEGLFVNQAGQAFLLTKGREGPPAVYAPQGALVDGASLTLQRLFTFAADDLDPASPLITGADLHAPSGRLLIRSYGSLMELSLGGPVDAVHLAQGVLRFVPAATEPQGEAVAWEPDGSAYLTASEQIGTISRVGCLP